MAEGSIASVGVQPLCSREERVVRVGHSGHCVDLEVLVGTVARDGLNRAPVGKAGLGIVEPFVGQVLHVVGVEVRNAVGDLGSVHAAAERQKLGTDLLVDGLVGLSVEERVPEVVTASHDLDVVQVMAVNSGKADTAVVHLAGEDLVTEEVVAEKSAVGVSKVVGISHGHVGQVTEECVHGVVLLLDVIKMLSVLVDSVGAEHVLEEEECVVVLVLDAGGVVENTNVGVVHLVITDEEKGRSVDSLVSVGLGAGSGLRDVSERLVHLIDKLFVGDVAGADDDEVVTEVVLGLEIGEIINAEVREHISVTLDGLTELMITVRVEVGVLEGSVLEVSVAILVVGSNFLLEDLELSGVEAGVGNSVTEHRDGTANVVLEDGHANAGLFTAGLTMKATTKGHNLLVNLGTGETLAATGEQVAEHVGSTSSSLSIVTGASTNVNTNGGSLGGGLLSGDADAVSKSSDLERTIELEGFGDLSTLQVAEVGRDGRLRELHVAFTLSQSKSTVSQHHFGKRVSFKTNSKENLLGLFLGQIDAEVVSLGFVVAEAPGSYSL